MKAKKVVITGTGLGGLTTALRLSTLGYEVEMLEKFGKPGGRLNRWESEGFTFDLGPTFFSMTYEFENLFRDCGMENPLRTVPLDTLYSVRFAGSDQVFRIYRDKQKLAQTFAKIEPGFSEKLEHYLQSAARIFHDTEHRILKSNFDNKAQYLLRLCTVPLAHIPSLFRSVWDELSAYFDSEEVKIIFSLVSFFLGDTPHHTPAIYKLLNYIELEHNSYWHVKGGMYQITECIYQELQKRGVKFHFNTEICNIQFKNGKISEISDLNGHTYSGDIFVINADAAAFRQRVLKRKKFSAQKLDHMQWTMAPFTMYLGIKGKIPALDFHNYFLGRNFNDYARKIFTSSESPEKPYYYVHAPSRLDPSCAPEGCENIFVLCPVPHLLYKNNWNDAETLATQIMHDLSERIGFPIEENLLVKKIMTPADWEQNFGLYRGSGLGLAHGLNQIGAFRPANKDEKFNNLYYVGASTLPGGGLPMVVIGSQLVTQRIKHEHPVI